MKVNGSLNSMANNPTHTYKKPTTDDYRFDTTQKEAIENASLTKPAELENPYQKQGVPNFIWQIFTKVTEKTDLYTQKSVENRLFANADSETKWAEQISVLKKSFEQPITEGQLNDLIEEKNMILSQFSQPRMSPSEERAFKDLIQSRQRAQATILDGMLAAISSVSYKPLEVAA